MDRQVSVNLSNSPPWGDPSPRTSEAFLTATSRDWSIATRVAKEDIEKRERERERVSFDH